MNKSKTSYDNTKCTSSRIGRSFAVFELLLSFSVGRWAPLPLRLIVGYGFAEHGFAKLLRGPIHGDTACDGTAPAARVCLDNDCNGNRRRTLYPGGGACSGSQHSDGSSPSTCRSDSRR